MQFFTKFWMDSSEQKFMVIILSLSVFVSASMAFALLLAFYLVIDEFNWWSGTTLYQAGT